MSEWIEPKTDWKVSYDENGKYIGDYLNKDDYNRIINNIRFLKELADKHYLPFSIEEMGNDKTYSDFPYASEWNAIEQNIVSLIENTYPISYTGDYYYQDETPTLNYEDLNRIEGTLLNIYKILKGQDDSVVKLAFTLGNTERW